MLVVIQDCKSNYNNDDKDSIYSIFTENYPIEDSEKSSWFFSERICLPGTLIYQH